MADDLLAEIIELKNVKNWSWSKIDRHFPHLKRETLRSMYRRAVGRKGAPAAETPNGDHIRVDKATNSQTVESRSGRIWTLDQLLEACQVDRSVWKVDHYIVNKWEVGAKPEWKDLTWKQGRIQKGYVKSDGLQVEPLVQVKAWLVRIKPLAIFPTIQPIECEPLDWEVQAPRSEGIGRALVFGDAHFGFSRDLRTHELVPLHDWRVLSVIIELAEYLAPDRIDILGDMLDLTDWNDKYLRSPEFTECTQPAIEDAHRFHRRLREVAPGAQIRAHAGNHEGRMERAIIRHLGAAYDLRAADELEMPPALSVPRLLALHQLDIEWVGDYPDDLDWINEGLSVAHGELARSVPGETARAVVRDADESAIVGHTHQVEMASRTLHVRGGERTITAVSPGCCCHIDGRVPAAKSRMQWQNGCAVVDYEIGRRAHTVQPLLITNAGLLWDGKRFEGRMTC